MVSHMSCNFDDGGLGSGVAYTATVASMFRLTSDKQHSYDLYLKWLKEGDTFDASRLTNATHSWREQGRQRYGGAIRSEAPYRRRVFSPAPNVHPYHKVIRTPTARDFLHAA